MGQVRSLVVAATADTPPVATLQAADSVDVAEVVPPSDLDTVLAEKPAVDAVVAVATDCLDGPEVVDTVQTSLPAIPVVVAGCSPAAATAALAADADAVVSAGAPDELLVHTVEQAVEQQRTAAAADRYRTLVETVGDAMYVLDEEGYIEYVNDAHVELSGYDRDELLGSFVGEFMPDEAVERGTELIVELLSSPDKEWARFEFPASQPDGEQRYYEDNLAVLTDDDGAYAGSVGIIRDITERKRTEQALERQNERLDQFASVVSHDLRNPITVAQGHLDDGLAEGGDLETAAREALVSLERMESIIEDVLTLAREGDSVEDVEVFDLEGIAEDAWASVALDEGTLVVEEGGRLCGDRSQVQQLLENLFRNAVEHSDDPVTIRVGRTAEGFYVEDDGPGVSEALDEDVFAWGTTTAGEGTGLGLAIVAQIAQAHGWEVALAESTTGGARFVFSGVEAAQ